MVLVFFCFIETNSFSNTLIHRFEFCCQTLVLLTFDFGAKIQTYRVFHSKHLYFNMNLINVLVFQRSCCKCFFAKRTLFEFSFSANFEIFFENFHRISTVFSIFLLIINGIYLLQVFYDRYPKHIWSQI